MKQYYLLNSIIIFLLILDIIKKIKRTITCISNSPFKKFFKEKPQVQINLYVTENIAKLPGVNILEIFSILLL